MKQLLLTTILVLKAGIFFAQTNTTNPGSTTKSIQPKIIVIPRVPEGINIKEFYDKDVNIQLAIAKINDAFSSRGANISSFDQSLKELKDNKMVNDAKGNSSDVISMILQKSSADIYVEVKIQIVDHDAREAKSVNLILDAYQAGTANIIANKAENGPMFKTDDIGLLTMMTMDKIADAFLNQMQMKFEDIVANGQSIFLELTVNDNAKINFDSEIKGTALWELIQGWVEEHAVNRVNNLQANSTNQQIYSDIRIPIRNPKNPNANYTGSHFYSDLNKFLKSIGIDSKREISTNNKLLITIL